MHAIQNPRAPLLQLLLLFNTTAVCGREVNRPSEICTVGGTYQQRRQVPAAIGTNKLRVKKKRFSVKRLCKKIARTTSHNVGVCYPNPRAPRLQLLLLSNTTALCGREVNRPSELCVRRIVVQELTLFYCVGLIQYCEGVIPSL